MPWIAGVLALRRTWRVVRRTAFGRLRRRCRAWRGISGCRSQRWRLPIAEHLRARQSTVVVDARGDLAAAKCNLAAPVACVQGYAGGTGVHRWACGLRNAKQVQNCVSACQTLFSRVELRGFEPLTFSLRRRANTTTSWRLSVDRVVSGDRLSRALQPRGAPGGTPRRPEPVGMSPDLKVGPTVRSRPLTRENTACRESFSADQRDIHEMRVSHNFPAISAT